MTHANNILPRVLLLAALALPCAAWAQDAPPPGRESMQPQRQGPPPFGHPGGEGPPWLRGLDLSEAQRDKLFALMHAQAPLLREQHKLAAKAHESLHALALAERFDETRGAALAQSAAEALAKIALQHARTEQQVMALLTPAQRKRVEQREQDGPPRPPRPQ